jgi:hypothetical protein
MQSVTIDPKTHSNKNIYPQMNADVFIVRLPLHGTTRINANNIAVTHAQAEVQRLSQIENRILVRKQRK